VLLLKLIPSDDRVESFFNIITAATPPNKNNIFKRENGIAYLLSIILDVHCPKYAPSPHRKLSISLAFLAASRWEVLVHVLCSDGYLV